MLHFGAGRGLLAALAAGALIFLAAPRAAAFTDPWNDPARVLVIYNTSWPDADGDGVGDSLEVAQYYAARRGVPAENLLGLALTPTGVNYDASQWALFLSELRDPLLAWLAAHGDSSVDTMLFCHGVPYQVDVPGLGARSLDSSLCVPYKITSGSTILFSGFKYNTTYFEGDPTVPPDKGHFDHALYSFQASPLYLHCRLDGISAEHSKALVDRAAYGHAHITKSPFGYTGVAYVDSRFGIYDDAAQQLGYPFGYNSYNNGDKSMAYGKFFAAASGFEWHWEPWETEIGEPGAVFTDSISAESAPAALFYEGWYNYGKYQHAWEWKTGAVACDLNSNSCQGIRDPGYVSFCGQAFQENLTAGAGVMNEPLITGHSRPDVLMWFAIHGFPWAETSCISDLTIKWMSLHVGDPLYWVDPDHATADVTPPAPFAWLGADHASLELELPAVPVSAPGGEEVFRVTQIASGASPAVTPVPVVQPDDRRLQKVAVPPSGSAGLTWAAPMLRDPAGNTAAPLLHFVAGPTAPALAIVDADDLDVGPGEPLVFRFSFSGAGGLLTQITAFSMTATAPVYGAVDLPIDALFIPLATNYTPTHNLDQVNFTVKFPPGVWKPGPVTLNVMLGANGQVSSSSVTVNVSN
jgi:uncharacterized protein (TIGR03790 family)